MILHLENTNKRIQYVIIHKELYHMRRLFVGVSLDSQNPIIFGYNTIDILRSDIFGFLLNMYAGSVRAITYDQLPSFS